MRLAARGALLGLVALATPACDWLAGYSSGDASGGSARDGAAGDGPVRLDIQVAEGPLGSEGSPPLDAPTPTEAGVSVNCPPLRDFMTHLLFDLDIASASLDVRLALVGTNGGTLYRIAPGKLLMQKEDAIGTYAQLKDLTLRHDARDRPHLLRGGAGGYRHEVHETQWSTVHEQVLTSGVTSVALARDANTLFGSAVDDTFRFNYAVDTSADQVKVCASPLALAGIRSLALGANADWLGVGLHPGTEVTRGWQKATAWCNVLRNRYVTQAVDPIERVVVVADAAALHFLGRDGSALDHTTVDSGGGRTSAAVLPSDTAGYDGRLLAATVDPASTRLHVVYADKTGTLRWIYQRSTGASWVRQAALGKLSADNPALRLRIAADSTRLHVLFDDGLTTQYGCRALPP